MLWKGEETYFSGQRLRSERARSDWRRRKKGHLLGHWQSECLLGSGFIFIYLFFARFALLCVALQSKRIKENSNVVVKRERMSTTWKEKSAPTLTGTMEVPFPPPGVTGRNHLEEKSRKKKRHQRTNMHMHALDHMFTYHREEQISIK
jgi:hypothetical protein